jgi:D-alanyl-D-alanine dipeptidase
MNLVASTQTSLVEITPDSHGVEIDIAYATSNNFTGKPVYSRPGCYLNRDAADHLARAVALAGHMGLRLKIFDAFRPSEAQWILWNHTPDPEFLADPRRGSPHSMGAAVDLTLIDAGGRELDMGTAFDAFTSLSHHGSLEISATAQRHRALLLGVMTSAGWDFYRNEWWHYQLFNARARYPVLSDTILPTPMVG